MSDQARLLQTEIDVVPGRRSQQPTVEGAMGPGSAIVRLTNTTTQENAYTVRVECAHPYWQESWVTVSAIAAAIGAGAAAPGKADQVGPHGRSVKVFVSTGGTRDVQVSVNVPTDPEARAGKYPLNVVVETQVVENTGSGPRKSRFADLPALAVIRPYYRWGMDVTPEDGRRVGMFRRTGDMEVVITNEGNDWLYCDVKTPRPKDLLVDVPSMRLAVPPPEPGEKQTTRTLPVRCTTRFRRLRGEPVGVPLPVTAQRMDAPSVPPSPAEMGVGGVGSNTSGAVVMTETSETRQPPGERAVVYCPPIPTTVTGCAGSLVQNARTMAMTVIGLLVVAHLAVLGYERVYHENVVAEPLELSVAPGGNLLIAGRYLHGSKVYLKAGSDEVAVPSRPGKRIAAPSGAVSEVLQTVPSGDQQCVSVTVPQQFDHQQVRVAVQRAGMLSYLSPLLPRYESHNPVQVGVGQSASGGGQVIPVGGSVQPGDMVNVLGRGLGASGQVYLNGQPATGVQWADNHIRFRVPREIPVGSTLTVIAETPDGRQLNAGQLTVARLVTDVKRTLSFTGGGGAGGGGAAGGGGSAGGGGGVDVPGGGTTSTGQGGAAVQAASAYQALLLEDFSQALQRSEQQLRQDRGNVEALAVRGFALAATNRSGEAAPFVQQAERATQGQRGRLAALALTARARLFEQANKEDADAVTGRYQSAIMADPTLELPYVALAGYFEERNQTQNQYEIVKLGLEASPNAGILHHAMAVVLYELGRKAESRQQAQKAAELTPEVKGMPTFRALARATGLRQ